MSPFSKTQCLRVTQTVCVGMSLDAGAVPGDTLRLLFQGVQQANENLCV